LGDNFIPGNTDRYDLGPLIRYSQVRLVLDDVGYIMAAFETGHAWTVLEDEDVFFSERILYTLFDTPYEFIVVANQCSPEK